MAKIGLPKGSGKRLKVSEKSGNFEMDIEWQPCIRLWCFLFILASVYHVILQYSTGDYCKYCTVCLLNRLCKI